MKTKPAIILYDVDQVLITGELFSEQYCREYALPRDAMRTFFTKDFPLCKLGKLDLRVAVEPYLREWNWSKDADSFIAHWLSSSANLDDQLLHHIERLRDRGLYCYVATNQERYRLAYLREVLDFNSLFDGVFCACEIGADKSSLDFYAYAYERLRQRHDVNKAEILFFDNSKKNVSVARRFGIQAYQYTTFESYRKRLLSYNIH